MADVNPKIAQAKPGMVTFTEEERARVEQTRTLACRYIEEVLNQGNESVLAEVLAPDFVLKHPQSREPIRGIEGFKSFLKMFRTAFPDFKLTVLDMIVEADKAAVRVKAEGTNSGPWMNHPATNKHATWSVANFLRVANGKIVENDVDENTLTMLEQLGITSIADMVNDKA